MNTTTDIQPGGDYVGYAEWKGWNNPFTCSSQQSAYFNGELEGIVLKDKRVLEIGFGQGSFVRWCHDRGAQVTACELIPELCDAGKALGFDTRNGLVQSCINADTEHFDLVAVFDVVEHIPTAEVVAFFAHLRKLLNPDGHLLVRVPNGQSPFGLIYQYGDITHINVLSPGRFQQIADASGLRMIVCANAYAPGEQGSGIAAILRRTLRRTLEFLIMKAYLLSPTPLAPNIVARFTPKAVA
ncbi:MAG: Cyclopropane-fatty-acyl-phospholipid [Rhodocyclales bacterium]|nr:Cyclopropane-fatty-acyl-phospholipid [Rhodocyclales bacterium]